ncbi:unnamed protein product [Closterium sp. NIES-64]|nr:unnamed protein product [Closterium sp. NIES-64]
MVEKSHPLGKVRAMREGCGERVGFGRLAGVFGAIRAKEVVPDLEVRVVEKSQPLGKVRISGGGRCNVTTGLTADPMVLPFFSSSLHLPSTLPPPSTSPPTTQGATHLSSHYPRGHRELKGSFFRTHGPADTVEWFTQRGVPLKTEPDGRMFPMSDSSQSVIDCLLSVSQTDGRMFPVSDSSQSVIDCLLSEAQQLSVTISPGWPVSSISRTPAGQFLITSSKKAPPITNSSSSPSSSPSSSTSPLSLMADFVLIATGGSIKGHDMAASLGHSIIPPCPSLFTFNIPDAALTALAGVSLEEVSLKLLVPSSPSSSSALSPLTSTTAATTTTTPTETADAAAATASAPAAVASTAKTKQKLRKDKETSFTQRGSLLFTHWGVSGPAVLKLSAWAARNLHASAYTGGCAETLRLGCRESALLCFTPHLSAAALLPALTASPPQLCSSPYTFLPALTASPPQLCSSPYTFLPLSLPRDKSVVLRRLPIPTLVTDFTPHLSAASLLSALTTAKSSLQAIHPDTLWAHVSKAHLLALADVIHKAELAVAGKGRFKDEFVTAGGVPLKEVFSLLPCPSPIPVSHSRLSFPSPIPLSHSNLPFLTPIPLSPSFPLLPSSLRSLLLPLIFVNLV